MSLVCPPSQRMIETVSVTRHSDDGPRVRSFPNSGNRFSSQSVVYSFPWEAEGNIEPPGEEKFNPVSIMGITISSSVSGMRLIFATSGMHSCASVPQRPASPFQEKMQMSPVTTTLMLIPCLCDLSLVPQCDFSCPMNPLPSGSSSCSACHMGWTSKWPPWSMNPTGPSWPCGWPFALGTPGC